MPKNGNPNFMSGVPELLILRLLAGREMYGYQLVQAIRAATGEAITLGEGVVYPALHALERAGALKATRKEVAGRSRVYYALTPKGARRLDDLTADWRTLDGAVGAVLEGGHGQTV
jgi:PadR family transcriptional regulator, regulatory protein PadR